MSQPHDVYQLMTFENMTKGIYLGLEEAVNAAKKFNEKVSCKYSQVNYINKIPLNKTGSYTEYASPVWDNGETDF